MFKFASNGDLARIARIAEAGLKQMKQRLVYKSEKGSGEFLYCLKCANHFLHGKHEPVQIEQDGTHMRQTLQSRLILARASV